jgi:hypothetical protein
MHTMPEANTRLREIDFVELVESSSGHGIAAQARRRLVVDAKMDWFRLRGYLAVLAAVLWSSGSRSGSVLYQTTDARCTA